MEEKSIFKRVANYKELHFYQKAETLVLLTDIFCKRFLPSYGDRTVDQMNQAARSGKQNIVEGSEAAMTSSETEVKLVNVGRASFQELREDYEDFLKRHRLVLWDKHHPRYSRMLDFCRAHNHWEHYQSLANSLNEEELCNLAVTLCHFTDKMFEGYLLHLEKTFREQGGIKERMHAVRTGYRQEQEARLRFLEEENAALKRKISELEKKLRGEEGKLV